MILLLVLLLLLVPTPSLALQCYTNCANGLCPNECAPSQNACIGTFRDDGRGTITLGDFQCVTFDTDSCQNTRCQPSVSRFGTHECCCDHDLCNYIPDLADHIRVTPPRPPTPSVSPPPPTANQLVCELYHCDEAGCIHNYIEFCSGHCTASYRIDERLNYVLRELGCSTEPLTSGINCTLDTSGSIEIVNCSCSGHLCNSIRALNFTDERMVVHAFDPCDELGCSHTCFTEADGGPSQCLCRTGHGRSDTDMTVCLDIDECEGDGHGCSERCENTEGSFVCACDDFKLLRPDGKTCYRPEGIICDFNTSVDSRVLPCDGDSMQQQCHLIFQSDMNGMNPEFSISGCVSGDIIEGITGTDECVLRFHPGIGIYMCSCTGPLCTRNFRFGEPVMMASTSLGISVTTTSENITNTPSNMITLERTFIRSSAIIGTVVGVAVILLVVIAILVLTCWSRRRRKGRGDSLTNRFSEEEAASHSVIDPSSVSIPSCSEPFNRGRFGKIHEATNTDPNFPSNVAVKILDCSRRGDLNYESWFRECSIFQELRVHAHPNILTYYGKWDGCDKHLKQLWIIVEFYPMGDLCQVLKNNEISWQQFYNLSLCLARGLNYLHYSQEGNKPQIAHRDFKSSNVLVKRRKDGLLECCISDFGLAITYPLEKSGCEVVGTPRYMAPEVLKGSINTTEILAIDMYAFSLTEWEMLTRTRPNNVADYCCPPYRAPYTSTILLGEPTPRLQTMKEFFLEDNSKRPEIPSVFLCQNDPQYNRIVTVIKATWATEPISRLTACNVLERLSPVDDSGTGSLVPASPQKAETTL